MLLRDVRLPVLLGLGFALSGGCAARTKGAMSPPRAPAQPSDSTGGSQVEKVREDVQVTPLELVFCAVRGEAVEENVAIRNTGTEPAQIVGLETGGDASKTFRITALPLLPLTLAAGTQASVGVTFAPSAESLPGVSRALLHVLVGLQREEGPPVDLAGLTLLGRRGDKEPPLQQVVEALGFAIDVGGADLRLGDRHPLGDEVKTPRFRRANSSQVSFYSVAHFGTEQRVPYGYYTGSDTPQPHPLGVIAGTQKPTLNPDMEPDGRTTFDPGSGSFGIFAKLGRNTVYTEDHRNEGGRHDVRVYPLKSRAGGHVPDAYVLAFEQTGDSDYQDSVFVIWNVQAER